MKFQKPFSNILKYNFLKSDKNLKTYIPAPGVLHMWVLYTIHWFVQCCIWSLGGDCGPTFVCSILTLGGDTVGRHIFGLYGQVECNHDSDIVLLKISPILVIEI